MGGNACSDNTLQYENRTGRVKADQRRYSIKLSLRQKYLYTNLCRNKPHSADMILPDFREIVPAECGFWLKNTFFGKKWIFSKKYVDSYLKR